MSLKKHIESAELADAVAQFQQAGGEIKSLPILPNREDKLKLGHHDKPADELLAIRQGKATERREGPVYRSKVLAYKLRLEAKA